MAEGTWGDGWKDRIYNLIRRDQTVSVTDFLRKHRNTPFFRTARLLSPEVAGAQIAILSFDEARQFGTVRNASMDTLCRVLHCHLKKGWMHGLHSERMMAGAYADWLAILEFRSGIPTLRESGVAVWQALEQSNPPIGWLPSDPDDPFIASAFDRGWE